MMYRVISLRLPACPITGYLGQPLKRARSLAAEAIGALKLSNQSKQDAAGVSRISLKKMRNNEAQLIRSSLYASSYS